jgi:hypothetical protein
LSLFSIPRLLHLHGPFHSVAGLFQVLNLSTFPTQPGAQQFFDCMLPGRAPNIERVVPFISVLWTYRLSM